MKYSEADRKAWKANLKAVADRVRAMPEDQREKLAAEYGTITAEGRALSPFNTIYLAMQAGRPLAQIGGFRQWGKAGRMVEKGEKAIGYIWVPLKRKTGVDGEDKLRFRLVPVFDVSQTAAIGAAESTVERVEAAG